MFSWSPPVIPNGKIISYTIIYNLTGLPVSEVVQNATHYRITGLEEHTFYQVTIFASTIVGAGPATQPLIIRTDIDSKCKIQLMTFRNTIPFLIVPTAPPLNFVATVTGTTSVEFYWQPPPIDDHNGILSYYQLRIVDESFNLTDITVNTTNLSYITDTLEEYIRYSCQVAAATDIGIGPFSAPIEITTLQKGELEQFLQTCMDAQDHSLS